MNLPAAQTASSRAFTLVEILVIAALISLFSAMAIFSMTYLVDSSKRKASIADVSTIGKTLGMVHMDFGFFPKVGYLSWPVERLRQPGNRLPADFDALGFNVPQMARKVLDEWQGPYLPNPTQRQVISPGYKGYSTRVRVPGDRGIVLDWPADPWGNPYVVYLIHLDSGAAATPRWINSPTEKANYIAVVVSYGKNRIPGGFSDMGPLSPGDQALVDSLKLYRTITDPIAEFETLSAQEYTTRHLLPLHNARGWQEAGFAGAYLSDPNIPGILDPGSDDIVYQIP